MNARSAEIWPLRIRTNHAGDERGICRSQLLATQTSHDQPIEALRDGGRVVARTSQSSALRTRIQLVCSTPRGGPHSTTESADSAARLKLFAPCRDKNRRNAP